MVSLTNGQHSAVMPNWRVTACTAGDLYVGCHYSQPGYSDVIIFTCPVGFKNAPALGGPALWRITGMGKQLQRFGL